MTDVLRQAGHFPKQNIDVYVHCFGWLDEMNGENKFREMRMLGDLCTILRLRILSRARSMIIDVMELGQKNQQRHYKRRFVSCDEIFWRGKHCYSRLSQMTNHIAASPFKY